MTRRDKLLAAIRANPKAVRFEDACKVAERLGFTYSGAADRARTAYSAGRTSPICSTFKIGAEQFRPTRRGN